MEIAKRCFFRAFLDAINPYAWVMDCRNRAFDTGMLKSRSFGIPTICIGNISVGGTGKTPHTEYIIRLLREHHRTAVLSRGYGRKSKGYIKADAEATMQLIGDEPFQIKNKFKDLSVAVCEKRVEGIEKLTAEDPELQVILLDDAYQHRYVNAGLKILLIDSNRPVWKDNVMPFGRLRESIGGIGRADIVIVTKCREFTPRMERYYKERIRRYKEMPIYFSTVRYGMPYPIFGKMTDRAEIATGSRILLVTGIAGPQPLRAEIEKRGADVTLMQYPDHHDFSTADLAEITKRYKALDCSMILTTEKDATRLLYRNDIPGEIRDSIYALPIEIKILNGEEDMFNQNIIDYVTENSRNR